jgi:peptidoglycan hydrolase-like protein with peptidoglycan-binding domain
VPRVQAVQYFLNVLSAYYNTIPSVDINGVLNTQTRTAIMEFQRTFNLPITGLVDEQTWNTMFNAVSGILRTLPPSAIALPALIWPGITYQLGSEGPGVYLIQQYLIYIGSVLEGIPPATPDGIYGPVTESAVRAFQEYFGIDVTGVVDRYTWDRIVHIYRNLRFGNTNDIDGLQGS